MRNLQRLLAVGIVGFSCLCSGCNTLNNMLDTQADVELTKGKIGDTEVKVVQNVIQMGKDSYSVEIYNSNGELKARFGFDSFPQGFIQYEDKRVVDLRSGEVIESPQQKNSCYEK